MKPSGSWDWVGGFNQANALYRDKQFGEAAKLYLKVTRTHPKLAKGWLGLARSQASQGFHRQAIASFNQCLGLEANDYSAWLELGHSLRMEGEMVRAEQKYRQAMALQPHRFEAPLGLLRTLAMTDRSNEAVLLIKEVEQALEASDDRRKLLTFYQKLGRYQLELAQLDAAFGALQKALTASVAIVEPMEHDKTLNMIRLDLAEIMLRWGDVTPAHRVLTAVSVSDDLEVLEALADLSYRFSLHAEAIEVLKKRVHLAHRSASTLLRLASMQAECWQLAEANGTLRAVEELGDPDVPVLELRARLAAKLGDAEEAFLLRKQFKEQQTERFKTPQPQSDSALAMSSLYCDFLTAEERVSLHRDGFAHLAEQSRLKSTFDWNAVAEAATRRKIRLGFVSADFYHQHPVNIFMQPVLRELDRSRFEVTVYFNGAAYDAETTKARQRVDRWVEATYLTDAQLATKIDEHRIDVLVDLSGHTDKNRMRVFGRRAAPIQVTYLGYPGSSGVPNIDWIIGDGVVTPKHHQYLYTERIATLNGNVFCFAPETDYPFPNYTADRAERPLTLGSFNNLTKVNQKTLALWLQIHQAMPESRLLLKAPSFAMEAAKRTYREKLSALGFDLSRVDLQGPVPLGEMMAEYANLDIALDPVPYNGGTTTLQAMWMGVPVVCKLGDYFTSRMSASFMSRIGLSDWVAQSDEEYVAVAIQKGRDRRALLDLKQAMRAMQLANAAWDPVKHTRSFEKCIQQILDAELSSMYPIRADPLP